MVYVIQNKEDLDQKISQAGDKLVVIDFFANWCGPCKIVSPKLEELSVQYIDKAVMLKVNVDDCEEIALEYNVTSMPTFVFIKNGQIIDVFVGGNSEKLVKNMEKFIGDGATAPATETEFGENTDTPPNPEVQSQPQTESQPQPQTESQPQPPAQEENFLD